MRLNILSMVTECIVLRQRGYILTVIKKDNMNTWKLYVIHFNTPYKHAKHYTGIALDVEKRITEHRKGTGARLTQVLKENNIDFSYTIIKEFNTFSEAHLEERRLKRIVKNACRYCPICLNKNGTI